MAGYDGDFGLIPDRSKSQIAGLMLGGVRPDSPAERAGLKVGDVIVRFAGIALRNVQDLNFAVRTRRPGDRVEVTFLRDREEQRVLATLGERK